MSIAPRRWQLPEWGGLTRSRLHLDHTEQPIVPVFLKRREQDLVLKRIQHGDLAADHGPEHHPVHDAAVLAADERKSQSAGFQMGVQTGRVRRAVQIESRDVEPVLVQRAIDVWMKAPSGAGVVEKGPVVDSESSAEPPLADIEAVRLVDGAGRVIAACVRLGLAFESRRSWAETPESGSAGPARSLPSGSTTRRGS